MVKIAKVGEAHSLDREALEDIILDGGLVVLILQDDDEDVVEMLGLRSGRWDWDDLG